ncbi:hypothetical protein RND81_05G266900 [Saponaria officinalis]|uniref:Uncharacterized protein n=1 Tax=Saponaria officinalis TaxID=3572 RepID=A0AAW1KX08_SAPOF
MNSVLVDHEFMNNIFKFNPELLLNFSKNQTFEETFQNLDLVNFNQNELCDGSDRIPDFAEQIENNNISPEIPDFPDDCLKFISDILLEEDFDDNSCSTQDYNALQATEKSLYDALGAQYPYPNPTSEEHKQITLKSRKKSRQRDEGDDDKGRISKIQATSNNEDYDEMEKYDDVLLCSEYEFNKFTQVNTRDGLNKSSRVKKQSSTKHDEVDLRVLLTQCAQAVSTFDLRTSNELLKKIRHHASPYGDSLQRLAHHMAYGLEARLAGTGPTISANIVDVKISTPDFLKAYKMYVSAIPFKRMSFFVANTTILKLAEKAKKIHIIDFGIFLGLQWPCLIKRLSQFSNGPPSLRITGIDYPQQGFRPAERIDATGRRLAGYSERFGVPFRYAGIADKWENIKINDLNLESDELVIVNCMYRSGTLLDETVDPNSPRDTFLKLVQDIKPKLFVHGVINGTFNAPFFITRFREALFHYSSIFEVFDATLPRESHERLFIESEGYGKEVYNLVACEGVERVQRPESYKQWRVRQTRAGMRQVGFDKGIVSRAKVMVKGNYHSDFLVDEDRHWMLQGWKGRIFCALSFWRPF